MRCLLIAVLAALCSCYIPPRPLPQWQADKLERGATVPCSSFHKGQRLGNGSSVVRVHRTYVLIRTRTNDSVVLPCRGR